uniref:Uncharacterized protein n=1 Tax=Plectus sambesii TaxID=2011161 RepID=A0A914V8K7_9BILA
LEQKILASPTYGGREPTKAPEAPKFDYANVVRRLLKGYEVDWRRTMRGDAIAIDPLLPLIPGLEEKLAEWEISVRSRIRDVVEAHLSKNQ